MTDYWLPVWWDWPTDPSVEIPPGLMALACVIPEFGGGTAVVTGSMRGNTAIHSQRQAQAAQRVTNQSVSVNVDRQQMGRLNRQ